VVMEEATNFFGDGEEGRENTGENRAAAVKGRGYWGFEPAALARNGRVVQILLKREGHVHKTDEKGGKEKGEAG